MMAALAEVRAEMESLNAMKSCVALLRGINVGGRQILAMAGLRALCEAMGFENVRTVLQSGNVVFESGKKSAHTIEGLLEKETSKRLEREIGYFVRDAREWREIVARNPFRDEAKRDPSHLLVMFFKQAPEARPLELLKEAIKGPEYFHAERRELYIVYPEGIGRSRLTGALIEKKLGIRGTGRNWNTVQKIAEAFG